MEESAAAVEKQKSIGLALRYPVASLLAALRFLTIIPLPWKSEEDGRFFQASLLWFPLIGLLIGAATVLPVALCVNVFPSPVTAVLAMILLAGVSGCLHLDGLADSGDGLLSARSRERALEIMRDSRSGAMGMVSLIFVLLGKYAALSSLPSSLLLISLFVIPMAGRTAIILSMALLPYARTGEGLGRLFYSTDKYAVAVLGILFCSVVTILFLSLQAALAVAIAVFITVGIFSFWCFRKLGGATGDTLGAVCELTELAVAVSLAVG
ncbi:MAG: adenosylcobinamide-GDP ribazoletransferase [Desulfocapsa sp.]|nr:adenosylcobinamide-GDP ribazoletransferase [Desulfocapsa sp.]